MKHDLNRDERRARARAVSAGVGLGLGAIGVTLWLAHPMRHDTWAHARAETKLDTALAPAAQVTTLDEAEIDGILRHDKAGEIHKLDTDGMTLRNITPIIPYGAMFDWEAAGAKASVQHADASARHGGLLPASRQREEAAAGSRAHRTLAREARAGGGVRAARADDYNEMVVKRASFRSCWEADASASGKISLQLVVDPAGGVRVSRVAASEAPDSVVSCVTARARNLPFRVPSDGGPRTFDVSSSYSRQLM